MPRLYRFALLACLLSACTNAPDAAPAFPAYSGASPGVFNGVLGPSPSSQIAQNLNTPLQVHFPARVGVLFYGYTPELQPEDQQSVMDALSMQLQTSGLVKSMVLIPATLTRPGDSLDSMRQLAASFQVDVLVLVSGSDSLTRAASQPLGFFDQFSSKAYMENRTVLQGLAIDVLSGQFLDPLQGVGKSAPSLLDPSDSAAYASGSYALEKVSETDALQALANKLKDALQAASQAPSASPTASPSPSPTPSATPSASPSA
ncbi:MAG TPA: hypothetical protein V6D47_20010 [Oscillatoriaceae cyanobacterium]